MPPPPSVRSRLDRHAGLAVAAAMLGLHAAVWLYAVGRGGEPWTSALDHWDSSWYTRIATHGYDERAAAYFPLYPYLVRVLSSLTGLAAFVPQVGTALSLALFLAFVAWVDRLRADEPLAAAALAPRTLAGWFAFLLAPASYVFHSHHTESLFVLLSLAAFVLAFRGRWAWAAAVAGVCALSRSQGILVAATVGLIAASQPATAGRRVGRFAGVALVSAPLFALYPLLTWWQLGDPLAFVHAKRFWTHSSGAWESIRSLWLGNPWQTTGPISLAGAAFFYLLVASVPILWRRSRPLAAYCALSLLTILVQAELAGAQRYGAALFPALFALGDRAARWPRWILYPLAVAWAVVNAWIARRYARNLWSY